MNHVLIVDDEVDIRGSLEAILREEDYVVTTTGTAAEALTLLRDSDFQAVLLDIWLPDGDGLEVLAKICHSVDGDRRPGAPEVIMISGHGTIEAAVRATKLGAYDFLEKPLSLDRTLLVLRNAVQAHRLREDNQEFARQLATRGSVTGQSVSIKALRQQIGLMAPTNGRVLIFGESGTGKERIARLIHAESERSERPLVEVNCAAIPEDYIEAELFGYRHGAGPGGPHQPTEKRGTFERADGGTLFLDEVGDMSLKTQAKVLRALDEQRVVGRFVHDGGVFLHVGRGGDDEADGARGVGDARLELHVLGAGRVENRGSCVGVRRIRSFRRALAQAADDVAQRADAQGLRGVRAVFVLGEHGVPVRRQRRRTNNVVDFVDEEFAREGHGTLIALLDGTEERIVSYDVFLRPAPLDAAVVLGIVEAGQGIRQTPVRGTACNGRELGTAVGAPSDFAFVPKRPMCAFVERHVASFGAHVDEPVQVALTVGEREEARNFEIEAISAGGQERSEC